MRALYLTSVEASSGKSVVALGLMETLTRSVSRVGYFRPVIRAGGRARQAHRAVPHPVQARAVLRRVLRGHHRRDPRLRRQRTSTPHWSAASSSASGSLADRCDYVLIEGTDYLGASKAFEFALNAEIASNLGAAALIVLTAADHHPDQVNGALTAAIDGLDERGVPDRGRVRQPGAGVRPGGHGRRPSPGARCRSGCCPELDSLTHPTIREVAEAAHATLLLGLRRGPVAGRAGHQGRRDERSAADGPPVPRARCSITPGDRSDVLMAAYASRQSEAIPAVSGVLLTGGLASGPHDPAVRRGHHAGASMPILLTDLDTYDTASARRRAAAPRSSRTTRARSPTP